MRRGSLVAVVCLLVPVRAATQRPALPVSSLAIRDAAGGWQTVWRSRDANQRSAAAPLLAAFAWQAGDAGMRWGEIELAGSGEGWRTRLVVAQLDPARVHLHLDSAFTTSRTPAWTVARAPAGAILAINAGQFESTMPWGWVRIGGRRWLPAQHGPLAPALMQDSSGRLRWIAGNRVAAAASSASGVQWAFQSYPALIADDTVVGPLRRAGGGVSVTHRDARAALCLARDGTLLVALTRFDALGSALGFIPFGLTAPEMAGIMAALGCRDAMLLDGGVSAQLLVRDADGGTHRWRGVRAVPLALVAEPDAGAPRSGLATRGGAW